MRFGVCYAHPDIIKKMFGLFTNTLNLPAMRGAIASYQDMEYQHFLRQKNKECQTIVSNMLDDLNLEYVESNANFIFFNAGRPSTEVAETNEETPYFDRASVSTIYQLGTPKSFKTRRNAIFHGNVP
jgi:histidinol-phosphate/aromatic aminotransferase/cobyric acid decarboxylase-like protein